MKDIFPIETVKQNVYLNSGYDDEIELINQYISDISNNGKTSMWTCRPKFNKTIIT